VAIDRTFSVRDNHTQAKLKTRDQNSNLEVGVSSRSAMDEYSSVKKKDATKITPVSIKFEVVPHNGSFLGGFRAVTIASPLFDVK
jgi:hypothetical protein